MKPLALDTRSCSCKMASWSVAVIAVEEDKRPWRDAATFSRATAPAPKVEAITPRTTRKAVTPPSHAERRLEATTPAARLESWAFSLVACISAS
jgi:hypothetical protein